MKFGWIEIGLIVLATVVVTLVGVWAWDSFKAWRINREYGPKNRRGVTSGRRRTD
jgi:cytoskeletal protein RodZ